MKKVILFMFSLTLFTVLSTKPSQINSSKSSETGSVSEIKQLQKEIKTLTELIKKESSKESKSITQNPRIIHKIKNLFTFMVDKADKLLSKKFILATLIILAPFVTIYCTFFDLKPLKAIFYKMSAKTAQSATEAGTPVIKGAIEGTVKGILNDKTTIFEVIGIWAGFGILGKIIKEIGDKAAPQMITAMGHCLKFIPFLFSRYVLKMTQFSLRKVR